MVLIRKFWEIVIDGKMKCFHRGTHPLFIFLAEEESHLNHKKTPFDNPDKKCHMWTTIKKVNVEARQN